MQPVDEKNEKNEKNVTKNNVTKMIPTMNNKQTKDKRQTKGINELKTRRVALC